MEIKPGMRFHRLVTVSHRVSKNGIPMWDCVCDCGNVKSVSVSGLLGLNQKPAIKSCGCIKRLKIGESSFNKLYYSYIKNAESRSIEFSINKDEFRNLTKLNCYYCNSSPDRVFTAKDLYGEYLYNGVDRIDNTKGYTRDNLVPCCKTCNVAKNNLSYRDFISWIDRVYFFIHRSR